MIHSMTGFGAASRDVDGFGLEVEARSVNHRHLDLRIRLPKFLADQEAPLKKRVQKMLERGKVDISVNLAAASGESTLEIDEAIAAQYFAAAETLRERHGLQAELDVASLLGMPGVTRLVETPIEPASLIEPVQSAVEEAVSAMIAMRAAEGETLAADFGRRLEEVARLAGQFEARSGEVVEVAKLRLKKRAEQIQREVGLLDEARLHQEVVMAADRLDITEELVRLSSHLDQFRETLATGGAGSPVGRRLDFLLQELGREANTVGSKASDAPLAQDVVQMKTELERIREQVQNVE